MTKNFSIPAYAALDLDHDDGIHTISLEVPGFPGRIIAISSKKETVQAHINKYRSPDNFKVVPINIGPDNKD